MSHVDQFYFVRVVKSTYPYGHVSERSLVDERKRLLYLHGDSNILINDNEQSRRNNVLSQTAQQTLSTDDVHTNIFYANMLSASHNGATSVSSSSKMINTSNVSQDQDQSSFVSQTHSHNATESRNNKKRIIDLRNKHDPRVRHHFCGSSRSSRRQKRKIISDGGATKHMFTIKALFDDYKPCTNTFVKMADGSLAPVLGIGNVGRLKDVLHVDNLAFDLVSESVCDLQGMRGEWYGGIRTVFTRTGSIFYNSYLEEGLYVVNPLLLDIIHDDYVDELHFSLATKAEAINLLHKRFGHVSKARCQNGVRSGHLPWTHEATPNKFEHCTEPCVVCRLAKSQRRQFSRPLHQVFVPGQHTYVDLWGPCDTPSLIDENLYAVGMIDGFSSHL